MNENNLIMKEKNIKLLLLLGLTIASESKLTPIVQTSNGPIQGEILKTVVESREYSSFRGIPYAEPPLGYMRFKPPVPKKPWTNVLKTTVEGSVCTQKDFVFRNFTGSEDCLYLNVHTPKVCSSVVLENIPAIFLKQLEYADTDNLLPVMVWIHGGSFKSGYGNSSLYGPDFIIEEGVVLVTFNYRLGPLGFLNLKHDNATGNAALKDQNLVLHWVKDNIEKFGGNPHDVTIFGQSAGGVSVDLHGLSDMSAGLFHRSITMSGSPLCPWAFDSSETAVKQGFALGEKLGVTTTSKDVLLQALYKASDLEIMNKTEEFGSFVPPFKPSVESTDVAIGQDKFLTECVYWKYLTGNFYKVPYLTGFVAFETIVFYGSFKNIFDMVTNATDDLETIANKSVALPVTKKVITEIVDGIQELTKSVIEELINETTDYEFVAGIDIRESLIRLHSNHPVYYYRFSYDTYQSLHRLFYHVDINGTAHGDDLAYPFHISLLDLSLDPSDITFITRRRMTRLWTNFAKYSNPTPDGEKDELLQGITWPDAGISKKYLIFDSDLNIGNDPTSATAKVYEAFAVTVLPNQTGCSDDIIKNIESLISSSSSNIFSDVQNTSKNKGYRGKY